MDVLPTSAVLGLPSGIAAADVGAHLGVRFVLHGAIRYSKDQWRLSLQLLDIHRGSTCFTHKSDLHLDRLPELEDELYRQITRALNRPLHPSVLPRRPRYSKDPLAYAEFMRGFKLNASGDPSLLEAAAQHLSTAIARDPGFPIAHATLALVCATRHFEFDPVSTWLEKAEFHCHRALELDPNLPEGHLARAFLLWGPSRNFQHIEAIAALRRALTLQNNLARGYNRLGTILAHIGLLDHARAMYQRARPFHPKRAVSHSIAQVYLWSRDYDAAREEIQAWRTESPGQKYPLYFAPQPAMMTGDWSAAETLLEEAARLLPGDSLVASLQGVFFALTGQPERAFRSISEACASPKSFGHAHHIYYQIACTLSLLKQPIVAFEWLERSVSTGFACWPFFLSDPCLENLRTLPAFEVLVSSLQSRYPDHLGLF